MPDETIKFTIQDLDASPLNSKIQPEIEVTSADALTAIRKHREISEKYVELLEKVGELRLQLKTKSELDSLIRPYAHRAYIFMCAYCAFVGSVVLMNGFMICGFKINDAVLQIIVGSTAVTVIGLVGMVLTGIFVGARQHS